MIEFKDLIVYWDITNDPLLLSYTDPQKNLPSRQIAIAYSLKSLPIKGEFEYIITTTTKAILADVITGKIPMITLFENKLFHLKNYFDRDKKLYKQSVTEVIDDKLFAKYLPKNNFYLNKTIPNRIDITAPLAYLQQPIIGLKEADTYIGVTIPDFTEEELKAIIAKQDPAESILLTQMYEDMPAQEFAEMAHHYDKYGDEPYMSHLTYVASHVEKDQKDLAYLHDTMEDHPTLRYLLQMIAQPELISKIDIITRKSDETYFEYINRIKDSADVDVIAVKLADLQANLSHQPNSKSLEKRYRKAIAILSEK